MWNVCTTRFVTSEFGIAPSTPPNTRNPNLPNCCAVEAAVVAGDLIPFSPGYSTVTGLAGEADLRQLILPVQSTAPVAAMDSAEIAAAFSAIGESMAPRYRQKRPRRVAQV